MTHVRRLASVLVIAATAVAAVAFGPRLATAPTAFVPPDDPWVRLDREITEAFGMPLPVVWVVEGRGGSVWRRDVLERLHAVTRAVLEIPGVIGTEVLSLASPNVRDLRVSDETLEPAYLMAEVPATDAALAELRERVEGDPMLHGQLVSRDGRAALVVAAVDPESDHGAVGRAALALRDRLEDDSTAIWVVGAPVLMRQLAMTWPAIALQAAAAVLAAASLAVAALGMRTAAAAGLAAVLAGSWGLLLAVLADVCIWPWSASGVLPGIVVAAAGAALARVPLSASASLGAGSAIVALTLVPPAHAFSLACVLSALAALPAAWVGAAVLARRPADDSASVTAVRPVRPAPPKRGVLVAGGVLVILAAVTATAQLRPAFSPAGHASRWLPAAAARDVRALERLFPPPTSLAVRLRGPSGFMAEPTLLRALDRAAELARAVPAVTSTLSLADLVAVVHRAFAGEEATGRFPEDRGLVARYLALAYSPGFRRVLDRALEQTVLWVQLRDDRIADLERVRTVLESTLAAEPPPDVTVDLLGGDGAVVLVAAASARRLALVTLALLAILSAAAGAARGRAALLLPGVAAAAALAVGGGLLVLAGMQLDLLTVPALAALAPAGAAVALLPPRPPHSPARSPVLALALASVPLLAVPLPPLRALGALVAGIAAATAVARR